MESNKLEVCTPNAQERQSIFRWPGTWWMCSVPVWVSSSNWRGKRQKKTVQRATDRLQYCPCSIHCSSRKPWCGFQEQREHAQTYSVCVHWWPWLAMRFVGALLITLCMLLPTSDIVPTRQPQRRTISRMMSWVLGGMCVTKCSFEGSENGVR